ncbi:MAG TPA: radical SAM protein [Candidatus Lokiarchaeia archaeon]|nr:radical SAM protein [Candidatus Lokiarchaeia archaeon]
MHMLGYFHCHWYVTTRCNSRCTTCSIWNDPKYKANESPLSERMNMLHQLKRMKFKTIDFTGGEPLLYHGLPALIKYARQLGFVTFLTTNGTLYPKFARELQGSLSALNFSLDAADRETHDAIRGIRCYDHVIRSIILARKLGELVMVKTTVSNDHIDAIPPLIRFAERYGVLIELNPEFSYFGNPRLSDENLRKLFTWWNHPNVIISHAHVQFMLDGGNNRSRPKCPIGKSVIVLSPDNGLYFPCMHYVQDVIPLQSLDLPATLATPAARDAIARVGRYPFCTNCTIPCYFEVAYYTQMDKYMFINFKSRLGYLKKRALLSVKNRSK